MIGSTRIDRQQVDKMFKDLIRYKRITAKRWDIVADEIGMGVSWLTKLVTRTDPNPTVDVMIKIAAYLDKVESEEEAA